MFCGRNECKKDIWVCENAFEELDEDKDTHDLLDCPKGWSERGFCTEDNWWPFADQYIRVCMKDLNTGTENFHSQKTFQSHRENQHPTVALFL